MQFIANYFTTWFAMLIRTDGDFEINKDGVLEVNNGIYGKVYGFYLLCIAVVIGLILFLYRRQPKEQNLSLPSKIMVVCLAINFGFMIIFAIFMWFSGNNPFIQNQICKNGGNLDCYWRGFCN
jgi:hypothetical protein